MNNEYTAQERAALIALRLADGAEMTTREIAEETGLSPNAAWYMMQKISRVIPIYQNGTGAWKRVPDYQAKAFRPNSPI